MMSFCLIYRDPNAPCSAQPGVAAPKVIIIFDWLIDATAACRHSGRLFHLPSIAQSAAGAQRSTSDALCRPRSRLCRLRHFFLLRFIRLLTPDAAFAVLISRAELPRRARYRDDPVLSAARPIVTGAILIAKERRLSRASPAVLRRPAARRRLFRFCVFCPDKDASRRCEMLLYETDMCVSTQQACSRYCNRMRDACIAARM